MEDPFNRRSLSASLYYRDPRAALAWLESVFGFRPVMLIEDAEGNLAHAEMRVGDSLIHVGSAWAEFTASPGDTGGRNTQLLHVQLEEDIDAHCARVRAAGAEILMEPEDQFYGDRCYRTRDPEGHVWNFAQAKRAVSRTEAEKATGFRIWATEWP